jgi:predicted nucleic acid-binding protein
MIVVSNTTPLNYLILIEAVDVLPGLFERIHVPEAVLIELGHSQAPALVRGWAARLPEWVQAHSLTTQPDAALAELQEGEREAIMLAADLGADLIPAR